VFQLTTNAVQRRIRALCAAATLAAAAAAPAAADETASYCANLPLLDVATGSSSIASPCSVAPRSFLVDSLYYQNASLVGGSALAAYPLTSLRFGIAPRLEVVLDPPSQIAASAHDGAALYPTSHSGYGFNYTLGESERLAWSAEAGVVPPASFYNTTETQPKYSLGLVSAYHLTRRVTFKAQLAAATSHSAGFGTVLPTTALGADLATDSSTRFSLDLGNRAVTRRAAEQSFGDISVKHLIFRKFAVNVGLGTAFNSVDNAKAHYLSSGLSFRL